MCDTCQSCSCDNLTLPVVVGPTGATGATGANGSDGTNGTSILHNDTTLSTTTSTSMGLFTASKEYDLPAGTLDTDGSKLKITSVFTTTGLGPGESARTAVYIGGSNFTGNLYPTSFPAWYLEVEGYLKVELDITRTNATTFFINVDSYLADNDGNTLNTFHFSETAVTVTDVDAGNLKFEVKGFIVGTLTLNCNQLTVEHLKK